MTPSTTAGREPNAATNPPSALGLAVQMATQAEFYAEEALRLLPKSDTTSPPEVAADAREQIRLRLQTEFLFPQLPPWKQTLLVALYWEKRTLTVLLNAPRLTVPTPMGPLIERVTSSVEHSFMSLASHIRRLVGYESLSPIQRILFDERYVRIQFSDPTARG